MPVVFDISLPLGAMEQYVDTLGKELRGEIGNHKLWIFGHLGDGNLHVIVQVQSQNYVTLRPKIEAIVYGSLGNLGGSISAEHGIGLEKKPYLSVCRSASEIELMRALKVALDPARMLKSWKDLLTGLDAMFCEVALEGVWRRGRVGERHIGVRPEQIEGITRQPGCLVLRSPVEDVQRHAAAGAPCRSSAVAEP